MCPSGARGSCTRKRRCSPYARADWHCSTCIIREASPPAHTSAKSGSLEYCGGTTETFFRFERNGIHLLLRTLLLFRTAEATYKLLLLQLACMHALDPRWHVLPKPLARLSPVQKSIDSRRELAVVSDMTLPSHPGQACTAHAHTHTRTRARVINTVYNRHLPLYKHSQPVIHSARVEARRALKPEFGKNEMNQQICIDACTPVVLQGAARTGSGVAASRAS